RLAARGMNEPGNLQSLLGHYTGFDAAHIQKAVGVLTEEDIYSKDFDLEQAASAYEKARIAWQQIKPDTQFAGIEKCREPIPCLLLKDSWHMDKTLVDLLVKEWRTDSELVATARKSLPPVDWWALGIKYYALLAVLLAILAVTGGLVVVHG